MNVGDLFQKLSFGEFNDHVIGMEGAGDIDPNHQSKIVSHANASLTEIYSKFAHKRDYVKFRMVAGVNRYLLDSKHAASNTDVGNTAERYILDTVADPFQDDIIKILGIQVLDDVATAEDESQDLHLNMRDSSVTSDRIKTLDYRTLYVEEPVPGRVVMIEYQANHKKLSIPPDTTEAIHIHPLLESALEAHIAYQSFGAMNSEMHLAKSRTLWGRYQIICERVELEDLIQETDNSARDRLRQKGFR